MKLRVGSRFGIALTLCAAALAVAACGGGGGGSSSSGQTGGQNPPGDASAQVVAALASLDSAALAGQLTDEQFANQVDQLFAAVDAEPGGVDRLASYLATQVMGNGFTFTRPPPARRSDKTAGEAFTDLRQSETGQMIEAFLSSVFNSILPEPLAMLLDFGQPEVFVSVSSASAYIEIKDALVNNRIQADTAADFQGRIPRNPFDARLALRRELGQAAEPALDALSSACFRDCGPPVGGAGIYSGPFSGTLVETGMGCVWQHAVSGTVTVVVWTGNGTLIDPYQGSFDVTGTDHASLVSGSPADCDSGGTIEIWDFFGTVRGDEGTVEADGEGSIGTGSFVAVLSGATVSGTAITGEFRFDGGLDAPLVRTVTLTKQ